jgi:hypothetical protein
MLPYLTFSVYIGEVKMTETNKKRCVPWFLWPFWAIWRLVVIIIELTGRVVGALLGLTLLILGVVVSLTIVGAIVGIPIIIFGFLLILRSLF